MKNKTENQTRPFCLAILLMLTLLLCRTGICGSSGATHQRPRGENASPSTGADSARALSPHWRSFIWDSLPHEWPSGSEQKVVLEAYQMRHWKPFFFTSRFEPTAGANELIRRIEEAGAEGIDPRPYNMEAVREKLGRLDGLRTSLSALAPDFSDSRAVFSDKSSFESSAPPAAAHAAHQASNATATPPSPESSQAADREREQKYRDVFREAGEIDIQLANRLMKFSREMNPFAGDAVLRSLQGELPMTEFIRKLEPASPHYKPLVKALAKYRELAKASWIPFNEKVPIKPGESGKHVANLQKRLQQEDFYKGSISGSFDRETQEAVRNFQHAHLQQADGAVGQKTKDWLNVPYRQKADMIRQTLKLIRESRIRTIEHGRFVRINIPEFLLEYYKDGAINETHRIIVGRASGKKVKFEGRMVGENQTPTLTSAIEQIVINPRWYVSDRISLELNSEASKDPQYWTRHGYVQMASHYPSGQPRVFQLPGPSNALGRVKFEFPNPYAVYLHDTPRRQLFQNARRDYSHGCIRLDKAEVLARTILTDEKNQAAQKIGLYIEKKNPSFIKLSQPVPIFLEYAPASSGENGQVLFPGDPYGLFKEEPEKKS